MFRIPFAPILGQPDRLENLRQFVSQSKDISSDFGHLQLRLIFRGGKTMKAPLSVLFLVNRFPESTLQAGDNVRRGLEVGKVVTEEQSF